MRIIWEETYKALNRVSGTHSKSLSNVKCCYCCCYALNCWYVYKWPWKTFSPFNTWAIIIVLVVLAVVTMTLIIVSRCFLLQCVPWLTLNLWGSQGKTPYPCFTDEKTEVKRAEGFTRGHTANAMGFGFWIQCSCCHLIYKTNILSYQNLNSFAH